VLALLLLAGCTRAGDPADPSPAPTPAVAPIPKPATRANATVTLTSVTFADDCGGAAPSKAPARAPAGAALAVDMERRRCEQTSMQLAIGALADTEIHIKSVEVFDETGTSIGVLAASKPQRWADGAAAYEAWDEKIAKGATARVSYALAQPRIDRYDSRDRTYTVKVIASIGGADQPLQTTVMVVGQPPAVPT